ncbi:MAG: Enoyl-CoA hydratase/isomerase [Deltaproteobacteria bacterium]|jgi:enoyl-CoA hydratase/carnithine racemase|nr:Enoyl-CoA hydratase/isomerase [Deltaproteobacteria bacterium]
MKYETIIVEKRNRVGWLIFNRPASLNAMNAKLMDETGQAWVELDNDPEVRVIVNSGMGRAFNTGADVKEIASDPLGMRRYEEKLRKFDLRLTGWHCGVQKPVICAVNGICGGGGLHYVADADIVIAASNATFMDPHSSVGQVVAYEAIGLVRRMPFEAVMRMALTGKYERVSAQRAYELGMISQVVDPPEKLFDEAQALAEKIAQNSPTAIIASKKALWGALEVGLTEAMKTGGKHLMDMWGHPDQTEGPKAFAEKREARWVEPKIER